MKIASPSDEVSIECSENRAFDRALVGGASYFGLEVRTGCAILGLFLQPQIVYTLKLLCPFPDSFQTHSRLIPDSA